MSSSRSPGPWGYPVVSNGNNRRSWPRRLYNFHVDLVSTWGHWSLGQILLKTLEGWRRTGSLWTRTRRLWTHHDLWPRLSSRGDSNRLRRHASHTHLTFSRRRHLKGRYLPVWGNASASNFLPGELNRKKLNLPVWEGNSFTLLKGCGLRVWRYTSRSYSNLLSGIVILRMKAVICLLGEAFLLFSSSITCLLGDTLRDLRTSCRE